MFERICTRSWDELKKLLDTGYLTFEKQRITRESPPNAVCPDYRLWDDWEQRKYHAGASTILGLITMEHINNIDTWIWHPHEALQN